MALIVNQIIVLDNLLGKYKIAVFDRVQCIEDRTFNKGTKQHKLCFELLKIMVKFFSCHGMPRKSTFGRVAQTTIIQVKRPTVERQSNEDEVGKYSSGRGGVLTQGYSEFTLDEVDQTFEI
jgi:hypothetical protein